MNYCRCGARWLGAIAKKLDNVDGMGFVATQEEADRVFAELREIVETEKSLED
jgi:hypothetical protein